MVNPDALLWALPAGSAVYILLAAMVVVSRRRANRGGAHVVMLILAAWLVGGLLETGGWSDGLVALGREISFACAALLPPAALISVCHFTRRRLRLRTRLALFVIPAMTVTLIALQHFGVAPVSALTLPLETVRAVNVQRWHWFNLVHAPYSFGLVAVAFALLLRDAARRGTGRRRHMLAVIVVAAIPIVGSALHVLGVDLKLPAVTAFLIAAISPLAAWLVLRHGVLTAVPLRHEQLFEQMHDGMIVINEQSEVIALNPAAEALLGIDPDAAVGKRLPDALPDLGATLETLMTDDGGELQVARGDHRVALRITAIRNAGLDAVVHLLRCRDVTREHAQQLQLVRSEELLSSLIENSSNAILRLHSDGDDDYQVTIANPVAAELFDIALDGFVGRRLTDVMATLASDELSRSLQAMLPAIREASDSGRAVETEFRVRAGSLERWFRMVAYPVGDDIGITCIDITRQREQERELESAAFLDSLTGVLNRRGFERRASACLAEQADDATGALLFVDLNNFKRVNDIHGHEIGDQVLQMTAERLHGALRDDDIVARIGGDEFVVLAPDSARPAAERLRERIETVLCEPYRVENKALNSSASVGMALFPDQGVTLTSLLRSADAAMYERKSRDRRTASGSFRVVATPD